MKWLNIGTNIAAILTALIAFFTLLQVQNQTTYSNRADIVASIEKKKFNLSFSEGALFKDIHFISTDSQSRIVEILLLNIGNGVSKKTEILWEINHNRLTETFELDGRPIFTGVNKVTEDGMIFIKPDIFFDDTENRIDFILPIGQEKGISKITFPKGYLNLWLNVFTKIIERCNNGENCDQVLPSFLEEYGRIKFRIKFEDIFGDKHYKQFGVFIYPGLVNLRSRQMTIKVEVEEIIKMEYKKAVELRIFDSNDNNISTNFLKL